uniref:Protein phosphatase, Mg2+/Mn2+ dependent, 1H n=1 Tax=Eptatretus burgeri TaxID=7764 RepID=A0A8C4PYC8_EPTBU
MLSRVRSAVSSLVGGLLPGPGSAETTGNGAASGTGTGDPGQTARFSYGRPDFLNLNTDELECSADHMARPILIPREAGRKMPWNTGYAERPLHSEDLQKKKKNTKCNIVDLEIHHAEQPPVAGFSFFRLSLCPLLHQDQQIERDKTKFHVPGGCTSLFAMYALGKLYIANAGDSRAIIIRGREVVPLTGEFTPETERQRLQYLAHLQPHLLGDEFSALEFPRRVQRKELGKKMLYRDHTMVEGKKARVMATIGVTRGLGDHDLKVYDSNISIKPFLSCVPEVRIYELATQEHIPNDVLIMATDGLWDVLSNDTVCDLVSNFLENCDPNDSNRYTLVAQELVMKARGVLRDKGWRISNEKLGSGDDISVFLFPLHYGNRTS